MIPGCAFWTLELGCFDPRSRTGSRQDETPHVSKLPGRDHGEPIPNTNMRLLNEI